MCLNDNNLDELFTIQQMSNEKKKERKETTFDSKGL